EHGAGRPLGAGGALARGAQPWRIEGRGGLACGVARCTAQHHDGPAQRPGLRLARADRHRNRRRHQRGGLHDVRRAAGRLRRGDPGGHGGAGAAVVRGGWLGARAHRTGHRTTLGIGERATMKNLSLSNLSKTYFDPYSGREVTAVRDVSLSVDQGEFVAVVGPSGCGKTTILNMIAGFVPQTGGEILLDGKPVAGPGPERGVVFQSFALFPWKTVLDNVGFGPKMRGQSKAECDRIAREYLELAGLAHAAERYPNELSGGMQQRVGVVRALANNPEVLLMDEPFASVDAQTRMTLQEELTRIWEQRRPTILFITHDVAEAVFLADRVIVLSKGGTVLKELAVGLPRPRHWDALMEDNSFKALSAEVLQLVRSA